MGVLQVMILCGIITSLIQMASTEPTAEIGGSTITGKTITFSKREANQYLGVPYAQPPVGPLRFQKPEPFQDYPSDFKAFDNPPSCPQYTTQPYPWYYNTTHQSEDCLYLNIWTPADASPSNKKAVMYYMYGGGHRYGSINDPIYNGTIMAAFWGVIVVTVNYRVGYFGFLTSNSEDAPGNVGLWDALEGLKWVNKNIEAFGGDASRITIAGESAGAVNVGYLAISPLAEGLYARQIMQTASPVTRRSDNNTQNLAFSQQLAVYVGCANESFTIKENPKEVVECLKGVDADKISHADYELAPRTGYHLIPQFGDEFLSEDPRVSIINGNFRCTDLFIGNIKDVGSFTLTAFENQDYFGFFGEKNPHLNRSFAEEMIRRRIANFPDQDAIVNHYLPDSLDESDYSIRTQAYTAMGDTAYLCPTIYYAEQCAEQGKNVYAYFFTRRPTNSPWAKWMGATHFDDVAFVFGRPIYEYDNELNNWEYYISEEILRVYTAFVRDGKPNSQWPLYNKETHTYKIIGDDGLGEDKDGGPHTDSCQFLRPNFGF